MDKNDNKFKFDFYEKFNKDPIFAQFVKDVFKWVLGVIIALFTVEEVVKPIYESMSEKKESVKNEIIISDWADSLNKTSNKKIDPSSDEYKSYMAFKNDVKIYIKKAEEFAQLEKAPAKPSDFGTIFGTVYLNKGLELYSLKKNIIEDMRLTAQKYDRQDLISEIDELSKNMLSWKNSFDNVYLRMKTYAENKKIVERWEAFLEKYKDSTQVSDTCCVEKYKYDNEDHELILDSREYMRNVQYLMQMYHTEDYYGIEKRFYELVDEYLWMVKDR